MSNSIDLVHIHFYSDRVVFTGQERSIQAKDGSNARVVTLLNNLITSKEVNDTKRIFEKLRENFYPTYVFENLEIDPPTLERVLIPAIDHPPSSLLCRNVHWNRIAQFPNHKVQSSFTSITLEDTQLNPSLINQFFKNSHIALEELILINNNKNQGTYRKTKKRDLGKRLEGCLGSLQNLQKLTIQINVFSMEDCQKQFPQIAHLCLRVHTLPDYDFLDCFPNLTSLEIETEDRSITKLPQILQEKGKHFDFLVIRSSHLKQEQIAEFIQTGQVLPGSAPALIEQPLANVDIGRSEIHPDSNLFNSPNSYLHDETLAALLAIPPVEVGTSTSHDLDFHLGEEDISTYFNQEEISDEPPPPAEATSSNNGVAADIPLEITDSPSIQVTFYPDQVAIKGDPALLHQINSDILSTNHLRYITRTKESSVISSSLNTFKKLCKDLNPIEWKFQDLRLTLSVIAHFMFIQRPSHPPRSLVLRNIVWEHKNANTKLLLFPPSLTSLTLDSTTIKGLKYASTNTLNAFTELYLRFAPIRRTMRRDDSIRILTKQIKENLSVLKNVINLHVHADLFAMNKDTVYPKITHAFIRAKEIVDYDFLDQLPNLILLEIASDSSNLKAFPKVLRNKKRRFISLILHSSRLTREELLDCANVVQILPLLDEIPNNSDPLQTVNLPYSHKRLRKESEVEPLHRRARTTNRSSQITPSSSAPISEATRLPSERETENVVAHHSYQPPARSPFVPPLTYPQPQMVPPQLRPVLTDPRFYPPAVQMMPYQSMPPQYFAYPPLPPMQPIPFVPYPYPQAPQPMEIENERKRRAEAEEALRAVRARTEAYYPPRFWQ